MELVIETPSLVWLPLAFFWLKNYIDKSRYEIHREKATSIVSIYSLTTLDIESTTDTQTP